MSNIVLCGCGALGSYIAMQIAREGDFFMLYDDDKVERVNVRTGTSAFSWEHVRQYKARALGSMLMRKYGATANPITRTVDYPVAYPAECNLLIDCFDNIEARAMTTIAGIPALHVSIGEQGLGAIEWDGVFQLPSQGYERGENPVCTNELGRNLILFTSTVASIIINKYLSTGVKESAYVSVDKLEIFR